MFKFTADRLPVLIVLLLTVIDFTVYLLLDNIWLLAGYLLLMIIPKGLISSWNHHHQHNPTFHYKPLNRTLEFFYALHTGATTNLWVLHHVLGHHRNFLDQSRDQSRWMRTDGSTMNALEYTLTIAFTSFFRGYKVGKNFPRVQRDFLAYSFLTFLIVALLCWYRFIPGLMIFLLPMMLSLMFTAWVTYDHHSGLHTDDPFQGSYNNINKAFNFFTGNLGYHTAHHYQQGLHWSKLPELHEKIKHEIPAELIRNKVFQL